MIPAPGTGLWAISNYKCLAWKPGGFLPPVREIGHLFEGWEPGQCKRDLMEAKYEVNL
jgi:hypothetical protein